MNTLTYENKQNLEKLIKIYENFEKIHMYAKQIERYEHKALRNNMHST